jgi:hypothetical protein
MQVKDPGHEYLFDLTLDGDAPQYLMFVKREGEGYPGNVGHHPGVTSQEVIRALIDRAEYVNNQIPCPETAASIELLKMVIYLYEKRAALRHGRPINFTVDEAAAGPGCFYCGHVGCYGACKRHTIAAMEEI